MLEFEVNNNLDYSLVSNGWRKPSEDFETLAIQCTMDPGTFCLNSLVTPIVTSSVFINHNSATEVHNNNAFHYGRCGNPTRNLFETSMAKLEGSKHALAFSSGVAAISALVQTFRSGDHFIYIQCTNGDADWLFRNKWRDFGFLVDFLYSSNVDHILQYVKDSTKLIWLETPANPTMDIVDIGEISDAIHNLNKDIKVAVDNTFLTPILQRPLELGADVAIYSCTKYICGHADVTMGVATFNCDELYKKMQDNQICLGAIPSPFDCYLIIRSIKTLPLRMRQHFLNGLKIAHFLEKHPCVIKVLHPGLKSHPQHELALRQQFGHSGMVGFFIRGGLEEAAKFLDSLQIFRKAPSLGADVSIVSIPAKASHAWLPEEERIRMGISENLIRLSVGLENASTLIQDIDRALKLSVKDWV